MSNLINIENDNVFYDELTVAEVRAIFDNDSQEQSENGTLEKILGLLDEAQGPVHDGSHGKTFVVIEITSG